MARSTFVYAIFLRTTPEKLWLALTEAENLAWWLSPDGGGKATHVETDARVGGGIRFVAYREGRAVVHSGEYLEVQRPRRLSFTLRNSASAVTERVTFLIEPRDEGCLLTLINKITPAPLLAFAPLGALAHCRAKPVARPRWPALEAKAALSLGLHLAMLPVLLVALREPAPAAGVRAPVAAAMMTVDLGVAEGVRLPRPSAAPAIVAAPARAESKKARHVTVPRARRQQNAAANNEAPRADAASPQAFSALGTPRQSSGGAELVSGGDGADGAMLRLRRDVASTRVEPPLPGTTCSGIISFPADGGVAGPHTVTGGGQTFYGGQKVPVEARFFQDRDGKLWIQFTLWPEAPWQLPVRMAGNEVRWTNVDGSDYALRLAANGHLTGVAGSTVGSAAKVDFTCAGSDAHPT